MLQDDLVKVVIFVASTVSEGLACVACAAGFGDMMLQIHLMISVALAVFGEHILSVSFVCDCALGKMIGKKLLHTAM